MVTQRKHEKSSTVKGQKNLSSAVQDSIRKKLEEAPKTEEAWTVINDKPGIYVWRIEDFKPKAVEKDQYGHFYDGDTYLILHAYTKMGVSLSYDLFIWIGNCSTADEYGTAAYMMADLDQHLNDVPVQHREVQSCESAKFLELFDRLTIMKGGHESAFRKVTEEKPQPKLLHISGIKKNVKVEEISYRRDNLTGDDVYILDYWNTVYQINGMNCSKDEKFRGASVVSEMKSSRKNVTVDIIDNFSPQTKHSVIDAMPKKERATLTKHQDTKRELSLWKLSDASGEMKMTKVASKKCEKKLLDTNDVFILDSGDIVYVWVGKKTSRAEKMLALAYAQKYAESVGCPKTPLTNVSEGAESEDMLLLLS